MSTFQTFARRASGCALLTLCLTLGLLQPSQARITRLEITSEQPAFDGQPFGDTGAYVRLTGRAFGEVDPKLPQNAIIQDVKLAPRNAHGMVEYSTDIDILMPAELSKGNGILLFEVVNRGRKLLLFNFNKTDPRSANSFAYIALTNPGDGFLMKQGFTLVWFGWQPDVLPGDGRMTMTVPIASNSDGSSIVGIVRAELTTPQPDVSVRTLNLGSGWFTTTTTDGYPAAETDNKKPFADGFLPTLTVRAREQDPRVPISNQDWSFGACNEAGEVSVNAKQICLLKGFEPGKLYELIYRAKDPKVMGLGFAVTRDLAAFLKGSPSDGAGFANPVYRQGTKAILIGTSQSGRMIRTFLHLGFNRDEKGKRAYEGAYVHIGGGLHPLNVRFSQPGRAWGQQVDHLYPAYDFPFTYAHEADPLTGRKQGVLDRCRASNTCPKIFHVATALEMWEGRQSLGLTDPLGLRDVPDPSEVRTYIMASTQHVPAGLPLATTPPFGVCEQQPNPNPQVWTMRALLTSLVAWVKYGTEPPASAAPHIADGTLVSPDHVEFPPIPENSYGDVKRPMVHAFGVNDPLHVLDFGPQFKPADSSGIITIEPPGVSAASYAILVPQVDEDGNDKAGIRSVMLQVPIGTYMGWNLGRKGRFEYEFCSLTGSFTPFARTREERIATGDPRRSLEERYPSEEAYIAAVKKCGGGPTSEALSAAR